MGSQDFTDSRVYLALRYQKLSDVFLRTLPMHSIRRIK